MECTKLCLRDGNVMVRGGDGPCTTTSWYDREWGAETLRGLYACLFLGWTARGITTPLVTSQLWCYCKSTSGPEVPPGAALSHLFILNHWGHLRAPAEHPREEQEQKTWRQLPRAGSRSARKAAGQLQEVNGAMVENSQINPFVGQERQNWAASHTATEALHS